jgi:glycosyltransferase involved in cell wall biosynthesis
MDITYFYRAEGLGFSIERLFNDIGIGVAPQFNAIKCYARFGGTNPFKIIYNGILAILKQGDINHITGDVHYLALFLPKRRTVLTVHDCVSLERLKGWKWHLSLWLWYRLPEKKSAVITVVSESTREQLMRYLNCNPDKIRVVHNCVSDAFQSSPKFFYSDHPVILQVGTSQNKNLLRVAEALQTISCHLRIVGRLTREQKKALEIYHIEYSNIYGISNELIVQEYRDCDMLLFVSTYEGFGLPIVEAQATGRPVVTSNLLSMPEVSGGAACLVDPYNVDEIRRGVLKVIKKRQYREKLILNGYQNVTQFRVENVSGKYKDIYQSLHRRS